MFVDHTVFYDIWSLTVSQTTEMYLLTGASIAPQPPISTSPPPIAHFRFTAPRGAVLPTLGTTGLDFARYALAITIMKVALIFSSC